MSKFTASSGDHSISSSGKSHDPAASSSAGENKTGRRDNLRETIESIVVAFILAFLFRTFEAEAFVIPTGSMAPTLYGRHKEVNCDQCGITYAVGASDEVDKDGVFLARNRLQTAFCPNCRFQMAIRDEPVFKGDRILVTKFPYEFGDPDRWDVLVFKYPEEPQINYIKRLIGLPGETLQIQQGDVYALRENQWEILRKDDPAKQRVLHQLVYDNDHAETELLEHGWPERWAAVTRTDGPGGIAGWGLDDHGWTADREQRSFQLDADRTTDGNFRWLRYRHIVPSQADWDAVLEEPPSPPTPNPQPQLISDFCGYNAFTGGNHTEWDYFWVGDLALSCDIEIQQSSAGGAVLFELNEGPRKYRCRIDLSTGTATLSHTVALSRDDEEESILTEAPTTLQGPGTYRISFTNVDNRLGLWVDGHYIDFGDAAEYQPFGGLKMQEPQDDDLVPVGIAAANASVRVSHLLLERDIYYRNEFIHPHSEQDDGFGARTIPEYDGHKAHLRDLLVNPQEWFHEYQRGLARNLMEYEDVSFQFELGPDEFFMMGDNSPRSRDSRLWTNLRLAEHRHSVPRNLLVGKAFFVYWPHGVPFMNDGRGYPITYHYQRGGPDGAQPTDYPSFRVPFYPYFERMRRIR